MAIDVTDETFQSEVIERSADVTVVVDLWAPWCGPCRTLGPIIEKVVEETNGRVVLVKVNVDESPQVSAAFKVQSIPAVFALQDRKVVDTFVGALPENQVRAWLNRFAPPRTEADDLADQDDEASLRAALEITRDHPVAVLKLAELLATAGDGEEALQLLSRVPQSQDTVRIAALARVGAAPAEDTTAVIAELGTLLGAVREDETIKQRYVDLLAILGDDPRVPDLRRKLANALF